MSLRRSWYALLGLLVLGPLLWAAYRKVREREAWELVVAAAGAHESVSYEGDAGWRKARWFKSIHVRRDSVTDLSEYRWSHGWSWIASRPSTRTPDPTAWCIDLDAVEDNYRARELTPTHYLGRPARTLELEPRHDGRPRVRLTIDAATSLPLKVETFGPDGTLYRATAFRNLEIAPQFVERRQRGWPAPDWMGSNVPVERLAEEAGFDVWWPAYLPKGFRCVESRIRKGVGPEIGLLFSDGVTAFELKQKIVQTPARIEAAFVRRWGPQRAERHLAMLLSRRIAAIAQSDGGGETVVRRRCWKSHSQYELRVQDRELSVSSRNDFDREEILKVLRSLRPR